MGSVLEICSLCKSARATLLAPFPVCAGCADDLEHTAVELAAMEEADANLKEIAERMDDVLAHIAGAPVTKFGIHERSLARMRAARDNWRGDT